MNEMDDVRAFARLSARLDEPFADRVTLLQSAGLNATSWANIREKWREKWALGDEAAAASARTFGDEYAASETEDSAFTSAPVENRLAVNSVDADSPPKSGAAFTGGAGSVVQPLDPTPVEPPAPSVSAVPSFLRDSAWKATTEGQSGPVSPAPRPVTPPNPAFAPSSLSTPGAVPSASPPFGAMAAPASTALPASTVAAFQLPATAFQPPLGAPGQTGGMPATPGPKEALPFNPNAPSALAVSSPKPAEKPALSGETSDVDIGAIARRVLVFGGANRPAAPPPSNAPPHVVVHSSAGVHSPPAGHSFGAASPPSAVPASTHSPTQAQGPQGSLAPSLTAQQYASLCVDLERQPFQSTEILKRYGTTAEGKVALDERWRRLFEEQPAQRTAFEQAKAAYRAWLASGGSR